MAKAIYTEKNGHIVADFDPAIAAQLQTLDLSQPLPDLWPQFAAFGEIPLMAIRGEHSRLLSEETLGKMSQRRPGLQKFVAHGQGHAPLLHRPDVFAAIVEFLSNA
jgi:pimeloyl-ACP methyl ester carboxylesterase